MSIAHVFVISVPRSFDGLPRCDKTTSSKSWPSSRVHQSGCSLHWQFVGFQLLQCGACFFGFRLGSAISVTFWLELAKERTRKNPSHPPYCVRDMGEDNWPSEPWYVQAGLLWLSRCARRGSWIQHQPRCPPGHVRKGSRV